MHNSAYINAQKFYEKYCKENIEEKDILDVGAYDVNGTMKPIFQKGKYVGVDMEKGPNVDIVANANDLPFSPESFDIVISSSCFEHDDMFWITFLEMCRVTKENGLIYVQAPQNGPYHGWPGDNWRFYADSWKALEKWGVRNGYNLELIESYIDETTPHHESEGMRIWNDSVGIFRMKERLYPKTNFNIKTIDKGHYEFLYRGVKTLKCPFDYATYQMIINEVQPDLIIEIGTHYGGNTIYMADLLNILGKGEVHTIDVKNFEQNEILDNHPRIKRFLNGYEGYDISITEKFKKIMVIDDGSHKYSDIISAFHKFKKIVSSNSYYIIEDGILNELGHDVFEFEGGPLKAIDEILKNNEDFVVEKKWSNFFGENATFNINGFLKRNGENQDDSQVTFNNKVALISSYCDTDEKILVLEKNIQEIKECGVDVIVISPFSLPEKITSLCDYVLVTKNNLVLDWPQKSMFQWMKWDVNGKNYYMGRSYPDYGFAGLLQVKQLSQIAIGLEYDQFFHLIYDIKITDYIKECFKSNKTCSVHSSKREEDTWEVGLHFMIFDKPNLQKLISLITLDSYLSYEKGDAFYWLNQIKEKLKYQIEKTPVEDVIYYYKDFDFFNYSPVSSFKLFIEKDDLIKGTSKLFFYNLEYPISIGLKVGLNVNWYNINNFDIIDLDFVGNPKENIIIIYDNVEYDITEKIKEVKHNELKIT